ncbi:MAG: hypothetical protein PHI35_04050 [Victivallaceae bacterium]|nr:hypothetical protein [Victivallaceae bacterium]
MSSGENIFSGFMAALTLCCDWVPERLKHRFDPAKGDAASTLIWTPVAGALLGVLPVVLGGLTGVLFNRVAGAAVFAVAALFVLDWKDSGRGLGLLVSLFVLRTRGYSTFDALPRLNHDLSGPLTVPVGAVFLPVLTMCKLGVLFLLAYYEERLYFVAVTAGGAAVRGMLLTLPRIGAKRVPAFDLTSAQAGRMWISAAAIGIWLLFFYPLGTVIAGAVVFIAVRESGRYFMREYSGVSGDLVNLAGAVTELVLLVLGMLFFK